MRGLAEGWPEGGEFHDAREHVAERLNQNNMEAEGGQAKKRRYSFSWKREGWRAIPAEAEPHKNKKNLTAGLPEGGG